MDDSLAIYDSSILIGLVGDDVAVVADFQQQFIQQAIGCIKELTIAYNQKNSAEIKEKAHFLKTSAKAVGALRCAERLQQIENDALQQNFENVKQLIMQLKGDIQTLKVTFKP